ncbi:hypothetical protein [Endozoicomonas sp. ALC066]|uniref:hypothetical protein n=1 Tax=Endozoicomonas sp. ALC066 TaxID=3403078 RepID=UPI003BB60A22
MNKKDKESLKRYFRALLEFRQEITEKFPDPGSFDGLEARQLSRDMFHAAKYHGLIEDYDLGNNTVTLIGGEVVSVN